MGKPPKQKEKLIIVAKKHADLTLVVHRQKTTWKFRVNSHTIINTSNIFQTFLYTTDPESRWCHDNEEITIPEEWELVPQAFGFAMDLIHLNFDRHGRRMDLPTTSISDLYHVLRVTR